MNKPEQPETWLTNLHAACDIVNKHRDRLISLAYHLDATGNDKLAETLKESAFELEIASSKIGRGIDLELTQTMRATSDTTTALVELAIGLTDPNRKTSK